MRDRRRRIRRDGGPRDDRRSCSRKSSARSATNTTSSPSRSSTKATAASCSAAKWTSTRSCSGSNVQIEREGFETVGGYLLSHLGRVPAVGERFDIDGLTVEVLDAERRRISKVRIIDGRRVATRPKARRRPIVMKSGFVSFIGRPERRQVDAAEPAGRHRSSPSSPTSRRRRRTRILGVKNYADAQVVFLDTPGIHRPLHRMNVRMVDTARRDDARGGRAGPRRRCRGAAGQGRPLRARSGQGRRTRRSF